MLINIDRMQLATPEPEATAKRWQALVGAELSGRSRVRCLNAQRLELRVGTSLVELLSPDGSGVIADAIAKRGAHYFSAGAATADVGAVAAQLAKYTDQTITENGQLFVQGTDINIPGLRLVISPHQDREPVGELDYLYEATVLAANADELTARFAKVFALDAQAFVGIDSPRFGYNGKLTLFKQRELHRFEVITAIETDKTMGRFFQKVGPCLYMGFAETSHLLAIEQRVKAANLGLTVDRPEGRSESTQADQVWLHPATLGGVMLGLSRPTMAWSWSGSPDRVVALD